jgi:tartrate dehydrogenase/decarboxylase / D-malate dehydrogenase
MFFSITSGVSDMTTYYVATMPGDGIGPEIIEEGRKVLDAAGEADGFEIEWTNYDFGAERYLATKKLLDEDDMKELSKYKAIYFGAVGDPRIAPGILEQGIVLAVRSYFDQYVNLRPVKLYEGVPTPLAKKTPKDINFVCMRENTEDFYAGLGAAAKGQHSIEKISMVRHRYTLDFEVEARLSQGEGFAYSIGAITRMGAERVIEYAFQYAEKHGMKKVSTADKANVIPQLYGFWRETFQEVAQRHPSIGNEMLYADATSMWFVKNPERFRVVVLPNLFGDILTDLGAAIQGGLGLAPGGNINPEGTSMFEPIHGSAPSYKGKNVSNPLATILAGGMLLEHLGLESAGAKVEEAVENVLKQGKVRTYDLGGKSKTSEMGTAVADEVRRLS